MRCVITPGHTPSHQSVIIDSSGQNAIYLGDLAPWAINMERLAWVPAADVEPLVSIETRRRIRGWALDEEALLIFEYDPSTVAGYFVREGMASRWKQWTFGRWAAERKPWDSLRAFSLVEISL